MADKDFDFKNIGKQMPYRAPDGFFEKMEEQMMKHAADDKKHKRQYRMKLIISVTLAAAAILMGVIFFPATKPEIEQFPSNSLIVSMDLDYSSPDVMDQYIADMSDEELAEWVELSENDIFIN